MSTTKDGRCEAFPKVGLLLLDEEKLVRKRKGLAVKSCDPEWNAKFTFVVSAAALSEFMLEGSSFSSSFFFFFFLCCLDTLSLFDSSSFLRFCY